jgi:hypothetical protein
MAAIRWYVHRLQRGHLFGPCRLSAVPQAGARCCAGPSPSLMLSKGPRLQRSSTKGACGSMRQKTNCTQRPRYSFGCATNDTKPPRRDTDVIRQVHILRTSNQPTRKERMSSMRASETSPIRTAARPTAPLPTVRRNPQWPFPVGASKRQNGGGVATDLGVVSTSERAYLAQKAPQ